MLTRTRAHLTNGESQAPDGQEPLGSAWCGFPLHMCHILNIYLAGFIYLCMWGCVFYVAPLGIVIVEKRNDFK